MDGPAEFLDRVLLLDIEVPPEPNERSPVRVGVARGRWSTSRESRDWSAAHLDRLIAGAGDFGMVLGHNALEHDLGTLRRSAPEARLLELPVVDTLYLSPLAFPQNPYHHLVKGYKLCKASLNDPVEDARLAGELFGDCWKHLRAHDAERPGLLSFYAWCFAAAAERLGDRGGLAAALRAIGHGAVRSLDGQEVSDLLPRLVAGFACPAQVRREWAEVGRAEERSAHVLALAYVVAWLPVAGSNSVIPIWVRRRLPQVGAILARWREARCEVGECAWCGEHHDPRRQLRRFFGFEGFRPQPADRDGRGLQEQIVAHGIAGGSHLAVLPTGGGKSLCFQLPALVRNFHRGSLTVVISPLQALMRDQVVNLRKKTGARAEALYGLLSPLERGRVLREVAMGDVSVLYIAPEQLRNQSFRGAVEHREIGAWVFDEAHCLSKWGHDFRPDYLYASRAIAEVAEGQGVDVPPIVCMTATAKQDVVDEIRAHFREVFGRELSVFLGGVERDNLRFAVEEVHGRKDGRVIELCRECLEEGEGGVIVYHATRSRTEAMAGFLTDAGIDARHFHGGLTAPEKKEVLDRFVDGALRVICATNAFGMGVDKPDVRLVVHADIPGTLENYLQEAGRAGRDQEPARCVLLYSEADIEKQFRLIKESELSRADMAQILRGLRRAGRRGGTEGEEFHITSGELLRDDGVNASFDDTERDADTRVRTAVSWLEKARLVERNLNQTTVFSCRPKVPSLEAARVAMDKAKVSGSSRGVWLAILHAMLQLAPDEGLTIDQLVALPAVHEWRERIPEDRRDERRISRAIIDQLRRMVEAGLVQAGTQMSAFLRHGVAESSDSRLARVREVERALLDLLPETAPDAEDGAEQGLTLRVLCHRLREREVQADVDLLAQALRSFGKVEACFGGAGRLRMRAVGPDAMRGRLQGTWAELRACVERRQEVAAAVLKALVELAGAHARPSAELLIAFSFERVVDVVQRDMVVNPHGLNLVEPVERALLFLHDHGVIILQNGLAVFRAAMAIRVLPEAKGRRYTEADHAPLREHYDGRTVQVHVMRRYAELFLRDHRAARQMVHDYFELPTGAFLERHFAGAREEVSRPVSTDAYRRIVDDLNDPDQQAVVTARAHQNLLVLAGPGSGKTRTVVHRCAYLLRVLRVPRSGVLVLCFNRSTVLELRRRLRALLDGGLGGLQIHTYDGLAMRLAGYSFSGTGEAPDFKAVREEAVRLLRGGDGGEGSDAEDELRDRLLRGYRFILVDEYQDIDASQYDLVSAITGRTHRDRGARLAILAVGDDDQNIYGFRETSNEFIRRFEADYDAVRHELVRNYRSTPLIVAASNRLIAHNPSRLKEREIQAVRSDPAGGTPVAVHVVPETSHQAELVAGLLAAHRGIRTGRQWNDVAVLATEWELLEPLRILCRDLDVPVRWAGDLGIRPWRVRETRRLRALCASMPRQTRTPDDLQGLLGEVIGACGANCWTEYLGRVVELWRAEVGDAELPARMFDEFLMEIMLQDKHLSTAETGVFLGTVFAAKGLEFDAVHLLDGGWAKGGSTGEERRRLFYVGMTRARSALHVVASRAHPFIAEMKGDGVVRAQPSEVLEGREGYGLGPRGRRLQRLDLGDYFIDFAGRRAPEHPTHEALAALRTGSRLGLRRVNGHLEMFADGFAAPVARLSDRGAGEWGARHIDSITTLALVERRAEESTPGFRERCRVDRWEIPLVEVEWSERPLG